MTHSTIPGERPTEHVAIVTGAHLCRNPRVVKEADALSAAGYHVTVLGPSFSATLAGEDRALADGCGWRHRLSTDLTRAGIDGVAPRLVRRAGTEAVRWLGIQTPEALGYGLRKTLAGARDLDADLYIGHQEVGLWVVDRLAGEGRTVGADLEDWYSEDLLPHARKGRPVALLRRLEAAALRRSGHVTTTSESMAGALACRYDAGAPAVIYNAFPWADRGALEEPPEDRRETARPTLHWFSQTVGAGRGLETLFAALPRLSRSVDVHLRGACSPAEEERLRRLFPTAGDHRLFLHGLVPNEELLGRIAGHDVGMALEPHDPPNSHLTVSNKILHYLLAGLPVVATETAGQREVAIGAPGAVRLCRSGSASSVASAIDRLLASRAALAGAKRAALEAARTRFCWERQVPVLLESVERALRTRRVEECRAS